MVDATKLRKKLETPMLFSLYRSFPPPEPPTIHERQTCFPRAFERELNNSPRPKRLQASLVSMTGHGRVLQKKILHWKTYNLKLRHQKTPSLHFKQGLEKAFSLLLEREELQIESYKFIPGIPISTFWHQNNHLLAPE